MSNESFSKAVQSLLSFHTTLEPKHETVSAVTGHPDGTVPVPNMANYIYCRLQGDNSKVVRAFNTTIPNNVSGLTIDLEIIKDAQGRITGYTVLGISKSIQYIVAPSSSVPISQLPPHHRSHEAARTGGGYDMVNVYEESIVALRGNAQSPATMKINVSRGTYWINGSRYYYAGGESPLFTADGDSVDVLCINSAGVLSIVAGAHGTWGGGAGGFSSGGTTPAFPAITAGLVPVAAINMTATLTAIEEANFGIDPRPFLASPNALTGSGVAGRVAIWTSATNIGSDSGLTYNSATDALTVGGTLTVGSSLLTGTSGNLTINGTAAKTLSLSFTDNYTLTIPATGTAALGTGVATQVAYWSGANALTSSANFTFDGTAIYVNGVGFSGSAGNLLIAGALSKTLSFTFTDSRNVTVPASGTMAFGTGTANRVAVWGGTNTVTSYATFTYNGVDALLVGSSDITGTSGNLTINGTATKTLTLSYTDNYTLTIPATGTAALLATANVFTATQTISNTAPSLVLTDTTVSAKSLTIAVDANVADLRESAGASGSLLSLDLANNRVGVGTAAPATELHVSGSVTVSAGINVGSASGAGTGEIKAIATSAVPFLFQSNNSLGCYLNINATGASGNDWYVGASINTGIAPVGSMIFYDNTAGAVKFSVSKSVGNVLIGVTSQGTSAARAIIMAGPGLSAAAPTTSVTDAFHVYGADAAAGKAWLSFREEGNTGTTRYVVGCDSIQGVSTGTGTVKMNGATSRNSVGWASFTLSDGTTGFFPYWTTITG